MEREARAEVPRPRVRDDLPGPDDESEPVSEDRAATHGVDRVAPGPWAPRGSRARRGDARTRRHRDARAASRRLPAPVLRRHAAARDDRDGALVRPATAHRRRADDRARRDDPGADPRTHRRAAEGRRHGPRAHHALARRRRRDVRPHGCHVRRSGRRRRPHRGRLRVAADAVHDRTPEERAAPRRAGDAARPRPGHSARPAATSERLPVPRALPVGRGSVCRGTSRTPRGAGPRRGAPPDRVPRGRDDDASAARSCVVREGEPVTGEPLLTVRGLEVHFPIERGVFFRHEIGRVRAVDGISFELRQGETLGLVGESGCGKSTTARAIIRLVQPTAGEVRFLGHDLATLDEETMRREVRRHLQMIFQDPYACLNPRMTVEQLVGEPLRNFGLSTFGLAGTGDLRDRVTELLQLVGLSPRHLDRYPHEFSGGQRQRIGIARALAANPQVVLCDEPVSALDVSIQAQVVNLLQDLQDQLGLTYLFIAHDLAVVRHISDRVAVMYLGRIVEVAPADEIYDLPLHPYTVALLSAIPIPDPAVQRSRHRIALQGEIPSPTKQYQGCRFADRCPVKIARCHTEDPPLVEHRPGHVAACWVTGPNGLAAGAMGGRAD
ncbi:MAG: ATP-binding cassette domain-containing protein [Planctomycetes bacterium]|nr:ATP-binding cassette domain-containing protein [Planctomycetota bacterium]